MLKNCRKLDIFFQKVAKNCNFFNKIANGKFCQFLFKCQVLGNFLSQIMAIFLKFSIQPILLFDQCSVNNCDTFQYYSVIWGDNPRPGT